MPRSLAPLLRDFINKESAGGLMLIAAAVLAMLWVNTGGNTTYTALLATPLAIGDAAYGVDKPLLLWINDGLMAVFFFLIGLEVKREIVAGQLGSWRQAALPVYAAIGGMMVPALVFIALNWNVPANLDGWAIPAATDIAFALGLLALLGSRVPPALKALLLAIAIIDDIGAIAIIALFYTAEMNLAALGFAFVPLALLFVLNRRNVASIWPYVIIAAILWVFVLKSGVHATLAGVAAAMFIPVTAGAKRPLETLEHILHPWVAFAVLPIFAFANAGVSFASTGIDALLAPLSLGIAAGLVLGKQIGIFGACVIAAKARAATIPEGVSWRQLYGLSCLAGIGFTMSLFIGGLAFTAPEQIAGVKMGVLSGSLVSALIGMFVLATAPRSDPTKRTDTIYA